LGKSAEGRRRPLTGCRRCPGSTGRAVTCWRGPTRRGCPANPAWQSPPSSRVAVRRPETVP
jgi:hypothetical protein